MLIIHPSTTEELINIAIKNDYNNIMTGSLIHFSTTVLEPLTGNIQQSDIHMTLCIVIIIKDIIEYS